MADLLTIEEAQRLILERVRPLPAERVPLAEAGGRVLAEDAAAIVDLPPFPSSAMDGYAVRSADTPGALPVAARIAAGRPAPRELRAGEAMAIATGGVVPEGADAVIPFEYVVERDNAVEISEPVAPAANVRPRGGDLRAGDTAVGRGVSLGPAQLGALAAAGIAEVVCAARPRASVVPEGSDAVIPFEYVVEHDNVVEIPEPVAPAANVRPRGGDLRAGDTVVGRGVALGPAQLGALAAAGIAEVACAARPRASVVATGTELRSPGEELAPGEVYEANGLILAAQLRSAGALPERLAIVADDEDAHRETLGRGLEADVLVTSGGVSVGPHDLVRRVEAELGVEEVFWRVAVKPGKPVSFGVRENTLVFGLPGNPVSSFVGFELFVRPAVLALQGHSDPLPRFEPGRLAGALKRNEARDQLVRARTRSGDEGELLLEPLTGQESHMIARAAAADALVLLPRGEGELPAGAAVQYLRI